MEYQRPREPREEYALILDYLEHGYPFESKGPLKTPIAQALGTAVFTLLELIPKKGVLIAPGEEVYIGEGKRDKIHHIKGKFAYERLTSTAQSELQHAVDELVKKNEKRYVDFFNNAQPMTTRMHQLELLPGLGKKHMWEIIEARREKPFESLEEIKNRIKLMPDPKGIIVKRILAEIEGKEKHRIFVRG